MVPSYGRINISLTPIPEKQIAGIHVAYGFSKDPYQHAEVDELILLHLEDVCVFFISAHSQKIGYLEVYILYPICIFRGMAFKC